MPKLEVGPDASHDHLVLVRTATGADLDFVTDLAGEVFTVYGDYRTLLPQWFRTSGVTTYVSESGGVRTGYVMLAFFTEGRLVVGDVLAVAVAPAHQSRGIGRMLMTHAITLCEQIAEHTPVRALRLSVADTNSRAQALFSSLGFQRLEGDFGRYDGGQQALHLERPIGP